MHKKIRPLYIGTGWKLCFKYHACLACLEGKSTCIILVRSENLQPNYAVQVAHWGFLACQAWRWKCNFLVHHSFHLGMHFPIVKKPLGTKLSIEQVTQITWILYSMTKPGITEAKFSKTYLEFISREYFLEKDTLYPTRNLITSPSYSSGQSKLWIPFRSMLILFLSDYYNYVVAYTLQQIKLCVFFRNIILVPHSYQ